jgi:hypothetical protein
MAAPRHLRDPIALLEPDCEIFLSGGATFGATGSQV